MLCWHKAFGLHRRHSPFLLLAFWSLTSSGFCLGQGTAALGNQDAALAQSRRFLQGRSLAHDIAMPDTFASVPQAAALAPGLGARSRLAAPVSAALPGNDLTAAWTPLGPATVQSSLYGPVTGRVTSIAVDGNDPTSNTVYLGTTGGGVWKSTNAAGAASAVIFTPLTDALPLFSLSAGNSALPSLSVGAVSVQPAANPVLLAGTGDPNDATDSYYGEGVLRSTDGGLTWTLVSGSDDGVNGKHSLTGLAAAGFAWSSTTSGLVVAALSTSAEGSLVGANTAGAVPGLYFSRDAGVTWQMAIVMDGSRIIEKASPLSSFAGASATSVVWSPQRQMFVAALRGHGYFGSPDGQNWSRLPNQPGTGLTATNCPVASSGGGSASCPIFRGTLAVQPATGDLYALTVDAANTDQGLWQDLCNANGSGRCSNAAPVFATRVDAGALEVGQGALNSSAQIAQGSYNLALAALPSANGGTLLFAGVLDLYRCSLAAGTSTCTFRNTTNAGNGCNASSAVAPAQHALAAGNGTLAGSLLLIGNDGGLWRSTDAIAQTGAACATTDAAHFQNLNPAIGSSGSLAEVVAFAQDPSQPGILLAGLGTLGTSTRGSGAGLVSWTELSNGEGGQPLIDQISPANWYVSTGAGINLKACTLGSACTAANFLGSADVGAIQTGYDTALVDAPLLLDPQAPGSVITGTCRVWRGPAQSGSSWNSTDALSPAMDRGGTPCSASGSLIRSLAAGGPASVTGALANQGSQVLYAGMAGTLDGGGTLPGHIFLTKNASNASGTVPWTDITGGPVNGSAVAFNNAGFDVSSVVVDTHDATGATVYATIMGFGTGPHVYRSADFGAHWTNLSANLPPVPANALVVDPNDANTVYLATDAGVYVTGAVATCSTQSCWSPLGSALPKAPVTTLQAGPQLPTGDGRVGMLRAGTYGRGLWETPLLTAHNLTQPQLSASPGSLSFLAQPVGTLSDAMTVTLLSFGNAPASVSSIAITGDFTETDTCVGQSIAANANCTVSVRFAPTAQGGRSGLITMYGNVPGGQVTVALNGTGSAPAAVLLTPLQLAFGPTMVNQTAPSRIVTLSNTGGNSASLQSTTITGDFAIVANTCGTSLPSQVGCSLAIAFTPTASGSRTGVLTVVDSAGTQTAQLSGTGQSPATDTLSPGQLTFTQQQIGTTSPAQQVVLANAGDVPLTLVTASVSGADFTAVNGCGATLAAHSSCAINVAFVPTAVGTRTGQLVVTDQFRTQTLSLAGAGLAPPGVSLSPSSLSFASVGVGATAAVSPVVLTNNGGVPLLIASAVTTGDFALVDSTCGVSLQPGTACTYSVAFTPTAAGTLSGTLTVTDNAGAGKQTVSLTGTGVDFALTSNGPTSVTVASGAVATFPVQLTSVAGLTGSVALSCSGAPANTVCTVNPSPAQLGGRVQLSVTLQTGLAASASASQRQPTSGARPFFLCLLLLPGALLRKRRVVRRVGLLCAATLALATASLLSGCGSTRIIPIGGTGAGGGGLGASVPTAPGTYPITLIGTSTGMTHSVQFSLTVN